MGSAKSKDFGGKGFRLAEPSPKLVALHFTFQALP